jgi:carbon monoxide dehydrogenase subunit G
MRVTGEATVSAPRDRVWWALNDPSVLVRAIPGCRQLEETGPDAYRMTVAAGVAAIKGTYDGEVRISEQHEPSSFLLHASGVGAPGTVSADVRITLTDAAAGATRLSYDAEAVIGGVLGGVGQRMIAGVARKTADEFFRNVEDVLSGRAPALTAVAGSDAGSESAADTDPADALRAARRFTRPSGSGEGRPTAQVAIGVVAGAVCALVGVVVGWVLGRRA